MQAMTMDNLHFNRVVFWVALLAVALPGNPVLAGETIEIVIDEVDGTDQVNLFGLMRGDLITEINGAPITLETYELRFLVKDSYENTRLTIKRGMNQRAVQIPAGVGWEWAYHPGWEAAVNDLYQEALRSTSSSEAGNGEEGHPSLLVQAVHLLLGKQKLGQASFLERQRGIRLSEQGEFGRSEEAFDHSVRLARQGEQPLLEAVTFYYWAVELGQRKSWTAAKVKLLAADNLLHPQRYPLFKALIHRRVGKVASELGDPAEADQYFRKSLDVRRQQVPTSLAFAESLNDCGSVAWNIGNLELAEAYFLRSFAIRERMVPGSLDLASSLNNLGVVARERGNLEDARSHCIRALEIRERLASGSLDVARSLDNLGDICRDQGELEDAWTYHLRALEISENLDPGNLQVASNLNSLGVDAIAQGNLCQAWSLNMRSLEIRERLAPQTLSVSSSLNNLGLIAWQQGELTKAQTYFLQSLEIKEKVAPQSIPLATSLNNLGNIAADQGNLQEAHSYYLRSLAIIEKVASQSLQMSSCLNNIGCVAADGGALEEARQYFLRSLEIRERKAPQSLDYAQSLTNLGDIARRRQKFEQAESYHQQALKIIGRLSPGSLKESNALKNLGEVWFDRGQLQQAENNLKQALKIMLTYAGGSWAESETRHLLGRTYAAQEDMARSLEQYRRAAAALEIQRGRIVSGASRSSFIDKWMMIFYDLIKALLQTAGTSDRPDLTETLEREAFHVAESARSRTFLETLAEARSHLNQGISHEMKVDEEKLLFLINKAWEDMNTADSEALRSGASSRLETLELKFDTFKEEIRLSEPRYAQFKYPQPLTLSAVQDCLRNDEILLEFVLASDFSCLFVVGPRRFEVQILPAKSEIQQQVKKIRTLLASPDLLSPSRPLSTLYTMLLGGVDLPQEARLIISADDYLNYLPFEALVTADGKYLIEKHAIGYVSSATLLSILRKDERNPTPRTLIAFGDPEFDSVQTTSEPRHPPGKFTRIPYSRKEVYSIAALFGDVCQRLGREATEEQVKSAKLDTFRYIHFATHALIDEQIPSRSRIVLGPAPDGASEGYLDINKIMNLEVNADLIVLSACGTSLGKLVRGEGMIGMTRAWFYAGAPTVIASLWSVNDMSTALLMAKLYEGLSSGLDKAEAIRRAKLWLLGDPDQAFYHHPYFWASFVLYGEIR